MPKRIIYIRVPQWLPRDNSFAVVLDTATGIPTVSYFKECTKSFISADAVAYDNTEEFFVSAHWI